MLPACAAKREPLNSADTLPPRVMERKDCWQEGDMQTLQSVMRAVMQKPLEADLVRDNYIQTFGCAYEEIDVEKNSIQAVYRAILQSLRNRQITVRDDLQALLNSRPPRPDNLEREYTIYVNLPKGDNESNVASYQVKILQLEVVRTVESHLAVWTRVASRFQHREDHYRAQPLSEEKSAFVKVIDKAQTILSLAERGKMEDILNMMEGRNGRDAVPNQPQTLAELLFGDRLTLMDENNPQKTYPAIYLGKGILVGATPRHGTAVFKFGEERLFGLRLNMRQFLRIDPQFEEFGYRAPETILQCMFLKASRKKPTRLSNH